MLIEVVWLGKYSLNHLGNHYMLRCVGGKIPLYLSYDLYLKCLLKINVVRFKLVHVIDACWVSSTKFSVLCSYALVRISHPSYSMS